MANLRKWNAPSLTTVLSTGLNSLANNAMSAASATINNDTNLDLNVDIEVNLAALSPVGSSYVVIYILLAVDGTNFPPQSDQDLRQCTTQVLAVLPTGATAATAQRIVAPNVTIPPGQFHITLPHQTPAPLTAPSKPLNST